MRMRVQLHIWGCYMKVNEKRNVFRFVNKEVIIWGFVFHGLRKIFSGRECD